MIFHSPFIKGQQFHKASGPTPPNCPIANSKKYIGLPARANIIMYGMRKAPETNTKLYEKIISFLI